MFGRTFKFPRQLVATLLVVLKLLKLFIPLSNKLSRSPPAVLPSHPSFWKTYHSLNIALMNELKMLFDKMDIDIWEVIESSKNQIFLVLKPFIPAPGMGGLYPY